MNYLVLVVLVNVLIALITILVIHKYRQSKEHYEGPLKVHFNAFWDGIHERNTVKYFLEFLSAIYKQPVTEGSEEESQILMESMFGETKVHSKKWKHTYQYSGEPDIRPNSDDYTVVLSGLPTGQPHNNIAVPYYGSVLYEVEDIPNIKTPHKMPVKDVVCIISNPGGGVRNAFLNELDKHFQVTYAGKYKNNIGGPISHHYLSREFIDYISQFKFIVAMENNERDSYITEKILHGFRAGIIPVYWGAKRTGDFINEDRMIHLKNEEHISTVIARMKAIAASESEWRTVASKPWKAPGKPQPTSEYAAKRVQEYLLSNKLM